jgi:hypothetical protein
MNDTASVMKKEIRLIAGFRALIISKYLLSLLLGFITLYLAQKNLTVSPLYVLLFLDLLPQIISYALKDYAKKSDHKILKAITEDHEFKLKQLKSKYKYTKLHYFSNSVSYLLALFLICLWQINYSHSMQNYPGLVNAPLFLLATGLLVRFFGVIFYQFKLPYDLRHNKL